MNCFDRKLIFDSTGDFLYIHGVKFNKHYELVIFNLNLWPYIFPFFFFSFFFFILSILTLDEKNVHNLKLESISNKDCLFWLPKRTPDTFQWQSVN